MGSLFRKGFSVVFVLFLAIIASVAGSEAFTLNVVDDTGAPVTGFRWLVEEDNTHTVTPNVQVADSLGVSIHKSHAPVLKAGKALGSSETIDMPSTARYAVSVLPLSGSYTIGGANVAIGQTDVTVTVVNHPLLTAQISVLVYNDFRPLNNEPGILGTENGLTGFTVKVYDQLGQQMMNAFGHPIGTTYQQKPDGSFVLDGDGNPVVDQMGDGFVLTNNKGEAFIKFLNPGKYGVRAEPPAGSGWVQTSTIEGTPTVDAWVKSGEPKTLIEFGPTFYHIFLGFTKMANILGQLPNPSGNKGTITGQVVQVHSAKPPLVQLNPGIPVQDCYVGLNTLRFGSLTRVYAQPCGPDGTFTINNVPPGLYQLVTWDKPLDVIFNFRNVTVPDVNGTTVDLGQVPVNMWFANYEGYVFADLNENGMRDEGEDGIPGQAVTLRFRDASIYKATTTNLSGFYQIKEVFPFFHWLTTDIDFLRLKATGVTVTVDDGGPVAPGEKLNPQLQPENGNQPFRVETGAVITSALYLWADQTIRVDWGKNAYSVGENGGISGNVIYATTRAEEDPALAAADAWEPSVPRVQMNLYLDSNKDGRIDDVNGDGLFHTLADQDNYPQGNFPGPEDIDRNYPGQVPGQFDAGDAVQIAYSDSWDDSPPTGCVGPAQSVHGQPIVDCSETMETWNQFRPGVWDGGYAFADYVPAGLDSGNPAVPLVAGTYIVEVSVPEGYKIAKEEDKNVDFGDAYIPSPLLLPPPCVGTLRTVPAELSLFPGIPAPFAGEKRRLCDRKQFTISGGQNALGDFHIFTEVPKAARGVGLVTNDLGITVPAGGIAIEKTPAQWIPIAFKDFKGNPITRIYSDEFGAYNVLLPSTYTVAAPIPTGVSPHMISICLNDPGPIPDPNNPGAFITDPQFDQRLSTTCYNFDFWPGKTTYLDTPVVPVSAFASANNPIDCEFPDGTPVIHTFNGPGGGPYVTGTGESVTILSLGTVEVANPDYDPNVPGSEATILRDFGFGPTAGSVKVGGVELQNVIWASDGLSISGTVAPGTATGANQVEITRGDNATKTVTGITLWVGGVPDVIKVNAGQSIQAAIDAATQKGTLILVAPGVYRENLIMWKDVRLQGSGAASTWIDASRFSGGAVDAWRAKLNELIANNKVSLIFGQDPTFLWEEGAGIMVIAKNGEFVSNPHGQIDGLTVSSAGNGGGIYVNGYGRYLEISNNRLLGNMGVLGGGIRIGIPTLRGGTVGYRSCQNNNINIHHNQITQNGGRNAGGGISLFNGSNAYRITGNYICGNFSAKTGGGIHHFGLSPNGVIERNKILFNESSFAETERGGPGGGIAISGEVGRPTAPATLTPGTGAVVINANLIQGNLSGAGFGGAIYLNQVNGQDVYNNPANKSKWYGIYVYNNMVVNNVAGYVGAIFLSDALKTFIINNTVANNDSTATGAAAFGPFGLTQSVPQPAGIVAGLNSAGITGLGITPVFSDPVLDNNIILNNRSFYWDEDENGGLGGLLPNPTMPDWSLQVLGSDVLKLNPRYCLLSDTAGYDASNVTGNPQFVSPYLNTLETAASPGEGGNFIGVTFRPLTLTGDYHIGAGSAAINDGTNIYLGNARLSKDYDGQNRPGNVDIGADERL